MKTQEIIIIAGLGLALLLLGGKRKGTPSVMLPEPDLPSRIPNTPITIKPALTECYKGYKIYTGDAIPSDNPWREQYPNYFYVFWDNPIFNVSGDKPTWLGSSTLAGIKQTIDTKIEQERNYKTVLEGGQC